MFFFNIPDTENMDHISRSTTEFNQKHSFDGTLK